MVAADRGGRSAYVLRNRGSRRSWADLAGKSGGSPPLSLDEPATHAALAAGLHPLRLNAAEEMAFKGRTDSYLAARNALLEAWEADPSRALKVEDFLDGAQRVRRRGQGRLACSRFCSASGT